MMTELDFKIKERRHPRNRKTRKTPKTILLFQYGPVFSKERIRLKNRMIKVNDQ